MCVSFMFFVCFSMRSSFWFIVFCFIVIGQDWWQLLHRNLLLTWQLMLFSMCLFSSICLFSFKMKIRLSLMFNILLCFFCWHLTIHYSSLKLFNTCSFGFWFVMLMMLLEYFSPPCQCRQCKARQSAVVKDKRDKQQKVI